MSYYPTCPKCGKVLEDCGCDGLQRPKIGRWFFPSYSGDFRLEADGEHCRLVLEKPTPAEVEQVEAFLKKAQAKKWVGKGFTYGEDNPVRLKASVAEAGKLLLSCVRPKQGTLTAVKMVNGELVATDDAGGEHRGEALDKVLGGEAAAAVSVRRPTPCCPDCVPGAVEKASEVLQEFLTPAQHESWAKRRQMVVTGHLSGHRYLLSHRHHPRAVKDTRICFDLDGGYELKFFDWAVPPEEEVLAAKLILEHQEPWLRNEATLYHMIEEYRAEPIFKNPFGARDDGTSDAAFFRAFGSFFRALSGEQPQTLTDQVDELITLESLGMRPSNVSVGYISEGG